MLVTLSVDTYRQQPAAIAALAIIAVASFAAEWATGAGAADDQATGLPDEATSPPPAARLCASQFTSPSP